MDECVFLLQAGRWRCKQHDSQKLTKTLRHLASVLPARAAGASSCWETGSQAFEQEFWTIQTAVVTSQTPLANWLVYRYQLRLSRVISNAFHGKRTRSFIFASSCIMSTSWVFLYACRSKFENLRHNCAPIMVYAGKNLIPLISSTPSLSQPLYNSLRAAPTMTSSL